MLAPKGCYLNKSFITTSLYLHTKSYVNSDYLILLESWSEYSDHIFVIRESVQLFHNYIGTFVN